jgi:hypothetical protein
LLTVILLIFNLLISVQAQKPPMKFGKIDPATFNIKSYDKDTSADALILGDYGESRMIYDPKDGFVVEYSRHFRAKIFRKGGYDLANHSLILYHTATGKEKIMALKGTVYNLEKGKVVESDLEKNMIFEEVIDNHHIEHKFTLPNVREGSIMEYYYQVRSDFWSFPDWQFQYSIPALWSEYRLNYPEYFAFKKLQKGYLALDVAETATIPVTISFVETSRDLNRGNMQNSSSTEQLRYMDNYFRWVKNDVPAFREEPYMNAPINYQSAMELELSSFKLPAGTLNIYTQTWEEINKELLQDDNFGLLIKRGGFLKDYIAPLKAANKDSLKLMVSAYNFIRNEMKWDGRNRIFATQGLRNAFDKKSGNSADINLMLVTLLKELGYTANPVIISTRSNGVIHPAQIMIGQFNYVIASARIGEDTYLLDATEKGCPYNLLPTRCINGQGRIISENSPGWIELNVTQRYERTNMITAAIDAEGQLSGKIQHLYGNFAALEKRIEVKGKKDNEDYIRNLENENQGLTIREYELLGIDSLSRPFQENLDVDISDVAQKAGDLISLSPIPFDIWTINPFKEANRKFPVDFIYPKLYKDIIIYTIPDGYVLDEKPADLVISLPDGKTKFSYKLMIAGNKLQISSTLDIGKRLYISDEYIALKDFFSKVVNKRAEKIVLKKSI